MAIDRTAAARMFRFGVVGTSGLLVNQGLLMLLHGAIGLPLLLSSLVAIETSILSNFTLNSLWTWKVGLGGSLRGWAQNAARYHAATITSAFAGNVVVLMALVHFFGTDYRIANLVGIAVGTVFNFLAGEFWVFRSPRRRTP
jgi:dolichol-phosphate mannosyltransferase